MPTLTPTQNAGFPRSLEPLCGSPAILPVRDAAFSRRPELGPFGAAPIYFDRAKQGHFWDVDGHEFVDTVLAFGPISLGYCYDAVDAAAKQQIDRGILGSVNKRPGNRGRAAAHGDGPLRRDGEILQDRGRGRRHRRPHRPGPYRPGQGSVLRLSRLARLVPGGQSGLRDHAKRAPPARHQRQGVPTALAGTVLPFEYNHVDSLRQAMEAHRGQVACIIMEAHPVQAPRARATSRPCESWPISIVVS